MSNKKSFIYKLYPIDKTILEYEGPFPDDRDIFRSFYKSLLKELADFAQKNSPFQWDNPNENFEYDFSELNYKFSELIEKFVNTENCEDFDLPPYRIYLHDNQATNLIKLAQMLDKYENNNLVSIRKEIWKEFKKINERFQNKNTNSVFPYCGTNKIISFDPEWNKIRMFSESLWNDFVFNGIKNHPME